MTTRSQKKSEASKSSPSPCKKRVESSWILFVKDTLLNNSNFKIITLPHPAHGKSTKYCLDDVNLKMYEIVTYNEPYRSWFIGDSVKSDGTLQMVTPINPLFLVLPKLKNQCMSRAMPLTDLLSEKGYDKILGFISNLDVIADLKGAPNMKAYKYNEEKTFIWLDERVRRLAKVLREKDIHVTSGAVSATFVTSNINNENVDEELYLKYAHGIISQYLQDDFVKTLESRFQFKTDLIESIGKKRKSESVENNDTNKRVKYDTEIYKEENLLSNTDKKEVKKEKPLTAKEKARQKAASGTKTISSFFAKK